MIESSVVDEELCNRYKHIDKKGQAYLSVGYYKKKSNNEFSNADNSFGAVTPLSDTGKA